MIKKGREKIIKKIINGKVYDTSTAAEIGSWWNGMADRDWKWCSETLHRKKTGEYFLHGAGGPLSKYAVSLGNNGWSGGEKIIPLTYDAARQWAEEHLDAEEYENEFGAVVEDDSATTLCVSVRADTAERIRRAASAAGTSVSDYLVRCFEAAQK